MMKLQGIFKRIASLALAGSLALSLAACGGGSNANPSSGNASTPGSSSAAPADPGTPAVTDASIAVGSTAQQFLGHFDASQYFSTECSTAATYLLYDQLFSIGCDGNWYSDILADYYWSEEVENQLVLVLKDSIYFSNGDQMTMEDVLYSMQALRPVSPRRHQLHRCGL